MSGFTRNGIYDFVRGEILTEYSDAYVTSRYVAKPPKFPAVLIHEIDRVRQIRGLQLDFQDNQYESVYEAQVVSTKANTASTEAYDIMEIVRAAFNDLFYREFSETNIDNGNQFTIVGRFRRIIGDGDSMPTSS